MFNFLFKSGNYSRGVVGDQWLCFAEAHWDTEDSTEKACSQSGKALSQFNL